jgi:hypothetical protein
MTRTRYQPDPNEERKVVYNPMTGGRRDLEVDKEDGAAAVKTHKRWGAARVTYLERLIADPTTSEEARAGYVRELERLKG